MGWLADGLNAVHNFTKKWEPIGHYSVENPLKTGDWLVKQGARGVMSLSKDLDPNDKLNANKLNTRLEGKAGENMANTGLSAERAATVASIVYGGINAYGAAAGSGSAAGGASTAGGGEVLGTAGTETAGGIGSGEALGSSASAGNVSTNGVYYEQGGGVITDAQYGTSGISGSGGGYLEQGGGYISPDGSYVNEAGQTVNPNATTGTGTTQSSPSLISQVANNKAAQTVAIQAAQRAAAKKPSESNQGTTTRPVQMPDPEAQAAARRRRQAEQLNRRGRAASIMTSDGT